MVFAWFGKRWKTILFLNNAVLSFYDILFSKIMHTYFLQTADKKLVARSFFYLMQYTSDRIFLGERGDYKRLHHFILHIDYIVDKSL